VNDCPIRVSPARYAKGKVAARDTDNRDGFTGRMGSLLQACGGRWSGRDHAYIMSAAAVDKACRLYLGGWHGSIRWGREPATVWHEGYNRVGFTIREALRLCDCPR